MGGGGFFMVKLMTKILIACNTLTSIQNGPYFDHARLYYRLGKDHPEIQFHQFFSRRTSIDRFRNLAARMAIDLGCDYLFFIDDDMQFDYTVFDKLLEGMLNGYNILAALNYIRGYPFDPMAFSYKSTGHLVHLSDEEIEGAAGTILECNAIGTAVCMINVEVLRWVAAPWFLTGPHNTEDIYFCIKAKEYYHATKIGVHTGAITGHLLDPEVISKHTRKHLLDYYESYMTPEQIESVKNDDRGIGYVKENIPALEQEESIYESGDLEDEIDKIYAEGS